MHRRGHYGLALLAFSPLAFLLDIGHASSATLVGIVIVAGVAPLPDFDQRIPFVKHRGITHTVWFIIGMSMTASAVTWIAAVQGGKTLHQTVPAAGPVSPVLPAFTVGFLVALGLTTHLLGDVITPMGIKPFAPVRETKYTWKLTTSGDATANNVLLVAGLGAIGAAIYIPHLLATIGA